MRLINADRAIAQEKQYAEEFKGDFGEQVAVHTIEILQHAPTVEAIPISFIKDQIALAKEVGTYQAVGAWQALIANWMKENSIDHEQTSDIQFDALAEDPR